jgi:hypothetical protein
MLTLSEKRSAILRMFPHISKPDLAQVAERIRTDSDLYRIGSIVCAYARHAKTAYDKLFTAGTGFYGSGWKIARETVSNDAQGVLKSWK